MTNCETDAQCCSNPIFSINGIKQECSVVDGVAELKLEEGEYRYTISAEHYYPQEGVLSVPTTSTDVVLALSPKVGWLSITSDSKAAIKTNRKAAELHPKF